jgi:CDP-glucose 4,6-dehydratase
MNYPELLAIYRGTRVLVTGHTGFKGSWLAIWLRELGAQVTGLALDPVTDPSLFREGRVADGIRDLRVDIRDHQALAAAVADARPDVVFHLAAQPLVRESYTLSRETMDINFMGSVHLFEAVRAVDSVRALVHVSTDKCYENREVPHGYREEDPLGGHDPYSASKAAAEIAFQSYSRSFFRVSGRPMAASGRAGNVIGGGDWARDRIVPDAMRSLVRGESIPVRNPGATRPWQHVLEALSGYLTLGAHLLHGETDVQGSWNFGPADGNVKTVRELVETVLPVWGSGAWHHLREEKPPHEASLLMLSCEKARTELGWTPRWDFPETIRRTVSWYRDFSQGSPARDLCLRDIRDYMGSA